ncbi:MAG TPA: response regulator [Rhodopila sp.]|nr:response regulator [Rhodopila sp.]
MSQKLLVVDDEKSITRIIGRIAESLDYEVFEVNDPADALDTFTRVQPDVLMLDMIMPDIDGVDILRQVAAMGTTTRIVVMSGFGSGYLRLAKAVAAFEDQPAIIELAKPFRRSGVIAVLDCARPVPPLPAATPGMTHAAPAWVAA